MIMHTVVVFVFMPQSAIIDHSIDLPILKIPTHHCLYLILDQYLILIFANI